MFFFITACTTFLFLAPVETPVKFQFTYTDKLEHAAVFLVLSLMLYRGFFSGIENKSKGLMSTALILAAYGGVIEILQSFTGRTPDIFDFAADIAGIAAGLGLVLLVSRFKSCRQDKRC